jgi:hypothetical protein
MAGNKRVTEYLVRWETPSMADRAFMHCEGPVTRAVVITWETRLQAKYTESTPRVVAFQRLDGDPVPAAERNERIERYELALNSIMRLDASRCDEASLLATDALYP